MPTEKRGRSRSKARDSTGDATNQEEKVVAPATPQNTKSAAEGSRASTSKQDKNNQAKPAATPQKQENNKPKPAASPAVAKDGAKKQQQQEQKKKDDKKDNKQQQQQAAAPVAAPAAAAVEKKENDKKKDENKNAAASSKKDEKKKGEEKKGNDKKENKKRKEREEEDNESNDDDDDAGEFDVVTGAEDMMETKSNVADIIEKKRKDLKEETKKMRDESRGVDEDVSGMKSGRDGADGEEEEEEDDEAAAEARRIKKEREAAFFDDAPIVMPAVSSFSSLHLSRPLIRAVAELGYKTPTRIQAMAIPLILEGKDICASARTGSGKTAMFMLPILDRLLYRSRVPAIRCLVITPTRELAAQCQAMTDALARFTSVRTALVIGGLKAKEQESRLRSRPDVVICTPGRIIDLVRNTQGVSLDDIEILVLDEADRLLEMGFRDEVLEVVRLCPHNRQTILTSATMTHEVDDLINLSLRRPSRVSDDASVRTSEESVSKVAVPSTLTQEFIRVREARETDRAAIVAALLMRTFTKGVIVFFREKRTCHRMRIALGLLGINVTELHGNLTQEQRLEAVEAIRDGKADIMLATDVASRGMDVPNISTVINFDTPKNITEYIHRVGRTARAGKSGRAITLADESPRTHQMVKEIVKAAPSAAKKRTVPSDVIAHCTKLLESIEEQIEEVVAEERIDRQIRIAEMEAQKARNMVEHEDEIMNRPAKTWFQTPKEKQAAKQASLDHQVEVGSLASSDAPLRQRKFSSTQERKTAGLSRAKRRRMDDDPPAIHKNHKPKSLRGDGGARHAKTAMKTMQKSKGKSILPPSKRAAAGGGGGGSGKGVSQHKAHHGFKSKQKHKRR